MTEPDRSAPLRAIEETHSSDPLQLIEWAQRMLTESVVPESLDVRRLLKQLHWSVRQLQIERAAGERRGRQQALEEAAESCEWLARQQMLPPTFSEMAQTLRARATRGDEAHQDTSLLPSITKAE